MCNSKDKQTRLRKPMVRQARYSLRSCGRDEPAGHIIMCLDPNTDPEPQPSCSTGVKLGAQQEASPWEEGKAVERIHAPHRLYRKRKRVKVTEDKNGEKGHLTKRKKITIQKLKDTQEEEGSLIKRTKNVRQLRDPQTIVPGFMLERPELSHAMHQALKRHILRERKTKKQALPMWAEQQRRNYVPRENSDQRQQRNRGRIDELLATNIQQEQLIDELVITQTQQQRCRKKRIDQLLSEQSKLQREIDALRMQKRELQYMINCSICLTSEHQKVVFLCGHSACWVCSNEINTCHICTRPIMARNPLFL